MEKQSKCKSKERNENGNSLPEEQPSMWYLRSREHVQLRSSETSQNRTPVFQNISVPMPKSNSPNMSQANGTHMLDENSQSLISDKTYDASPRRPGTPALLRPTVDVVYGEKPQRISGNDGNQPYSSRYGIENYAAFDRFLPDSRSTGACQPPQLYSFLASALQGNIARPLEGHVLPQHMYPTDLQNVRGNGHRFPNTEQTEYFKDPVKHSFRLYQLQQLRSHDISDVRRHSSVNHNILHPSMVRLNNGANLDDTEDKSSIPNGDEFHDDGEGNHECLNLRHGLRQENGSDLEHASGIAVPCFAENLADTPVVNRMDLNQFAALGASIYQGEWPINRALWMSGPSSIGEKDSLSGLVGDDTESIMSFSSSTAAGTRHSHSHQLGTKVEMVYSLLSMLGSSNRDDMSKTLLEMSNNRESCIAMRQSGCLPLLVQLLHGADHDYVLSDQDPNSLRWALREARRRAGQALHNIVYAHPDDKRGRREARVLRLLEQIRDYSDYLKDIDTGSHDITQNENLDLHPGPAIAALMKLSFDEEHRHAMCLLGGLQAIAELIQADHEVHGNTNDQFCITVRRYAGMALTNLTFGDGTNKALLCSMKPFMQALVAQLHSPNEDLRQVTASVLRNLSWRADAASKQILKEVGAVVTLMKTSMQTSKESTLKSILSALWNLSAHCSVNKADICAIDGALEFLVSTLTYKSSSKTLSIVENGGGILRNISSHIAVKEEYRKVLRKHNCLQTLLRHLKSPSLTVVSNACGTLWNLSARCQQDQQALWEMGAVGMLRNLIHSKHKMISMGSAAALKNLLASRPPGMGLGLGGYMENGHHQNGSQCNSPSLLVRKQRALEADIDQNLSETCDNIDSPKTSPTSSSNKKFTFESNGVKPHYLSYLPGRMYHSINGHVTSPLYVPRSESRDSLGSTHSEPPHYRAQCERFRIFVNTNRQLPLDLRTVQEKPSEWKEKTNLELEDNTNIVMQLFKSLHDNTITVANGNNMQNIHTSFNTNRPSVPNNLASVRKGVWKVPNREVTKNENRNIPLENGINGESSNQNVHQLYMNGTDPLYNIETNESGVSPRNKFVNQSEEKQNASSHSDINAFRELPENKRPLYKERISNQAQSLGHIIPPVLNGHVADSEKIEKSHFDPQINDTVSEGSILNKSHTDVVQENVVLRRKMKSDISHWSSTSTLKEPDSEDTDQTPLAISRCSSLSSLASCLQQSARSSWISDISSRRTSGIISPSEILDSPTSEMKLSVSRFTDKAPDAESLGIPRPRPAWPSSISSFSSNSNSNVHQITSSEMRSPQRLNQLPLLRAITNIAERKNYKDENSKSSSSNELPYAYEKDACPSPESSSSLENEDEGKVTENERSICINLGVPNNSSTNTIYNNSKLHSRVNNLSSSFSYMRSGIPVKANNVRLTQSVPNVSRPVVLSSCAVAPLIPESEDIPVDNSKTSTVFPRHGQFQVCDDNDNLLFRCQSSNQSQKNIVAQLGDFSSTFQPDLRCRPNLRNRDKVGEASDSNSLPQSSNHEFKSYPRHDELGLQRDILGNLYYANGSRVEYDMSSNPEKSDSQCMAFGENYSLTNTSVLDESSEDISQMSHDKKKGKGKTSIPQMVRPWHPSLDNEVHPKQLQIMSQNLPVYKGPFAVHHGLTQEKNYDSQTETCSKESQVVEDNNHFTDVSSPSADSEVSSAELLQECIDIGKVSRINRSKTKRNKYLGRSQEINTPPDHSSDEDKFVCESQLSLEHSPSIQYSEGEEKGKEDERTKEKSKEFSLPIHAIPDLLEGATCHADIAAKKGIEGKHIIGVKCADTSRGMSDSAELRKGAFLITAELEEIADDHTHSSASCFSDLDNIKPPSVMGEMSMTSSGLSDLLSNGNGNGNGKCYINGKNHVDRRRNLKRIKKANGSHRFVFKSVLQSRDVARSTENSEKPSSITGSIENLSMKSSGTSEILDNINPPSVMDDISMTNSCASLNSINSDILESRSQSLADPRSDSEMFQRLNAAAAMVQVYSRELSNIMTGSMKSSYNSDNLDQVKPPSVFQDIAEVTVEDGTEVGSDAMISDSELEEELPHDDEGSIPSTETVHSPVHALSRTDQAEGSTENLNSSFEGDSIGNIEKPYHSIKRISSLALTPQNTSIIHMDSNTVQHSVHSLAKSETATKSLTEEYRLTYAGSGMIHVDQNEEANLKIASPSPVRRGPRIVKPINRETIRQMQEKKTTEKATKLVRGKLGSPPKSTQRTFLRSGVTVKSTSATKKNVLVNAVRPTKTSALRASQSQKQTDNKHVNGRTSPRSFLSKPPTTRSVTRSTRTSTVTVTKPAVNGTSDSNKMQTTQKPAPPVKQGTFTKEEPSQNAPAISPISSNDSPSVPELHMGKSQNESNSSELKTDEQNVNTSESQASKITGPIINHNVKLSNNVKPSNSSDVKRCSSNYSLRRNISLPLQRKENSKITLRPSPSTQSFGIQKESVKISDCSSSKSAVFSRSSLSSLSSSSLPLKRASSQKEVTSKISSIWKKSESSSSANSPVTDSSITERITPAGGKTKIVSPKITTTNALSFNTPAISSQENSTRNLTSEKAEKSKSGNTVLLKRHSFIKSSVMNPRVTTNFSRTTTTITSSRKVNAAIKSESSSQIKAIVSEANEKNASCTSKTGFGPSQTDQQNLQRTAVNKSVSLVTTPSDYERSQESKIFLNKGQSRVEKSVLPEEMKASPASATVPPFNYVPCASSKQQYDMQVNVDIKSKDTTCVNEDESENSESSSERGKKCLMRMGRKVTSHWKRMEVSHHFCPPSVILRNKLRVIKIF